jgi:hypothetical protein
LALHVDKNNVLNFKAINCDFIGPNGASAAHRAIVNERWEIRNEDGYLVEDGEIGTMAELPDWFADLACRPPAPPKSRPWWMFWRRGARP